VSARDWDTEGEGVSLELEIGLYRIRVRVTINDGRWRAGVPIFGHPAPEMITDSPAVLNRIKHLKSEAQLP
jgi:hypothetical protein